MEQAEYYGWLVSTLPARNLAVAAARKLRRRALTQARDLIKPFQRPFNIVQALGVPSFEALANRVRENDVGLHPFEPRDRQRARAVATAHFPTHAQETLERADRVLAGMLPLFGKYRFHARGILENDIRAIDWACDPLRGTQAPDLPSTDLRLDAPGLDARAIWEAGRCAHLVTLAQAHLLAGLPGTEGARGEATPGVYARALSLHLRDFATTQPLGRGIHWTCAMEAALRAVNIAYALSLLRDEETFGGGFWADALTLLVEHLDFVEENLEDTQAVPGNHLLSNLAALAIVPLLFPELPDALERRHEAVEAFASELLDQTTDEGLSFESSTAYHRFVTELVLFVEICARRQGLTLGAPALKRLTLMCDVVEGATMADGRLPQVGDNDASFAFSFVEREPLDGTPIAALRAGLGLGRVRAPTPEALWLLGGMGVQGLEEIVDDAPSPQAFSASGLAVLTTGDRSVSLWAGRNGQLGLGGHAHNDKLAAEVVIRGVRVCVDPGSPVYFANRAERDSYRSTAAHPTVRVDGLEQSPIPKGRTFLLPDTCNARLLRASRDGAEGEHRGFDTLKPGVVHRREVSLPPGLQAVSVVDRLLGEGEHVVEVIWPLAVGDIVEREANERERALLERLQGLDGEGRFNPKRVFSLGTRPEVFLAVATEQPYEARVDVSHWSPGYGRRLEGRTLRLLFHGGLPLSCTTVFVSPDRPIGSELVH